MWTQIRTLAWAQWLTIRNHLPRTTVGSLISLSLAVIWYGGFVALAVLVATSLPEIPLPALRFSMGAALLGVFLFWQLAPLLTLTGGWSLDLKKLQIYPLTTNTLLVMEALLRVTAGVEMLLLLLGGCVGLFLHKGIPVFAPLGLLLFVPFNLLVSLITREIFLRAFRKTRLREILTVLLLCAGILPQTIIHFGWSHPMAHGFFVVSNLRWAPWHDVAAVATAVQPLPHTLAILLWIVAAWSLARRQFGSSIREEDVLTTTVVRPETRWSLNRLLEFPTRLFADPVSALMAKEVRSLLRMPRFRVAFLLATVMSLFLLVPLGSANAGKFASQNFISIVNLYGLIILGEPLIWNIFGFDRGAAQFYFAAPVDIRAVFTAKNAVAAIFIAVQGLIAICFAPLLRMHTSLPAALTALCVSATLGVFYLAVGNLSSVTMARPMDPRSTVKKQTGASAQFWILGCSLGSIVLIGFAYLAGWATNNAWASRGVLAVEFAIGLVCYRVSLDSAVERLDAVQDEMLSALSRVSVSPVS